jgi:GT2 family glycosyltransferase
MNRAPRVHAVVVHYADAAQTAECVRSLRSQSGIGVSGVDVIDNSTGRDALELRRLLPDLVITETQRNLGFADGVNVGMDRARATAPDFIWVITPDAVPAPDCLQYLLEAMAADDRIGICGPLIDASGELIAGCRLIEYLGFLVVVHSVGEAELSELPQVRHTDFVEGCSMLIRAETASRLAPFRTEFFLYYEECEYCLRARDAGWGLAVACKARVVTRARRSERNLRGYYLMRNSVLMARIRRRFVAMAVMRNLAQAFVRGVTKPRALVDGIRAVRDGLSVSLSR